MVFQICFDVYESATQHFIDEVMEGLGIKQKKEETTAMDVESSGNTYFHGKKRCDLRDPGSLLKAHSSCTIENWPCVAGAYLPCRNHVEYEIVLSGIILLCGH